MKLWIDDERPMPKEFTHWARSSDEAVLHLLAHADGPIDLVSFDHDLGGTTSDDTSRPVLMWMIENAVWPKEIRFHTANPVGYDWLLGTAKRYAPKWVNVNSFSPYAEWM